MKTNFKATLTAIFFSFLISLGGFSQPGCSPSSTNPSCATATALVIGGPCVSGTTCDGGPQAASTCLYAGSDCSWYSFVASATDMYVNVDVTATDGCHISSNVYSSSGGGAGGGCPGTQISCQSGAPLSDLHALSGLTIGHIYYIQVCYSNGGPCGNNGQADYCISVGEPSTPCATCSAPCGTASGFPTNPTVAAVVASCITTPFVPELAASSTHTYCYNFIATATSVDFNVIITSNCGAGNVTGLTWSLYNNPACGAAIQTGTLAGLTFTGLTVNNDYVFCYTFTVPAACTHTQHCPFFVGATVPLPVSLTDFTAELNDDNHVELLWNTASEQDNDFFEVERSADGDLFETVATVDGAGNSTMTNTYKAFDRDPLNGISYYRLKQTDFNGQFSYSDIVAINLEGSGMQLHPNPVSGKGQLVFESSTSEMVKVSVLDVFGRVVLTREISAVKGVNSVVLDLETLNQGLYILNLEIGDGMKSLKFNKE